jgi:hypothetical protein
MDGIVYNTTGKVLITDPAYCLFVVRRGEFDHRHLRYEILRDTRSCRRAARTGRPGRRGDEDLVIPVTGWIRFESTGRTGPRAVRVT